MRAKLSYLRFFVVVFFFDARALARSDKFQISELLMADVEANSLYVGVLKVFISLVTWGCGVNGAGGGLVFNQRDKCF